MKTKLIASIMGLVAFASSASVTITDIIVRQQWPWNGKVNIDYVLSDPSGGEHDINVVLRNANQVITNVYGSLTGDLFGVKSGAHRIVWDPQFNSPTYVDKVMADFSVTLSTSDDAATYMVVDLSGGSNAAEYPVSFTNTPPEGGWNQTIYKTDKLVLRRIPAGSFKMGSPEDEIGREARTESLHKVTFTNDFYMAIFETTQKQFENVMGTNINQVGKGDALPVGYVDYYILRGSNALYRASDKAEGTWPVHEATSFFGVLNSKLPAYALSAAGLGDYEMELPTISQWQYACRAGTTGAWNNGTTITNETTDANADLLAWYTGNFYGYPKEGGQKLPNAYGLYDMHGNISELVRDRFLYYTYYSTTVWGDGDLVEPLRSDFDSRYAVVTVYCGGYNNQGSINGAKGVRAAKSENRAPDTAAGAATKVGFRMVLTRKR